MAGKKTEITASATESGDETRKRLYRSVQDRVVAGVCAGFGSYFALDVVVIRVIWAAAVLLGGIGLWAYVLCWILIPPNPEERVEEHPSERSKTTLVIGVVLLAIGVLLMLQTFDWFYYHPLRFNLRPLWYWHLDLEMVVAVLLIVGGIIYLSRVGARSPTGEPQSKSGGTAVKNKLMRSTKDRMFSGVCGGLAEYFDIDPSLVRIGFALVTLFTGFFFGIVAYVVMMIVIPEDSASDARAQSSGTKSSKSRG